MVIRLLVAIAGRDFSYAAGDLYDCDAAAAARMIASGAAEPVARAAVVETATVSAPEQAVSRGRRGKS